MIETAEEFIRLRSSPLPEDYRRAANESAPIEVWRELVAHEPAMRFWVAQNKTVPLEVLRTLATDVDPRVRSMVARKRRLDNATLRSLAEDADEGVRLAVVRNPSTPDAVLRLLARDAWSEVAAASQRRLERVRHSGSP